MAMPSAKSMSPHEQHSGASSPGDKTNTHTATDYDAPSLQQTDDPYDPLNWSARKKHAILAIISVAGFLPDFASSEGVGALLPQTQYWMLPPNTVQRNLVGNLFMLGAGGLFVVPLSAYFGRLPVLVGFQAAALGLGIWCALATSFESYLAARILNGFFATVAQAGGLMWIQDMFYRHERARKINIWSSGLVVAPYLGPLTAYFVVWHASWRWCFWIYTILNALVLLAVLAFADETYYSRSATKLERNAPRSRWARLVGIEQWQNRSARVTVADAVLPVVLIATKAPVLLTVIYNFVFFAWLVGVNATVGIWLNMLYGFGPPQLGLFYLSGVVGVLIGWVIGHWLHDVLANAAARRSASGRVEPESRLLAAYPASAVMIVALVLLGFALQRHWHYMVIAVCYAAQVVGAMVASVSVSAYVLDSYPDAPGEASTWANISRAWGGFMATYIQIEWVEAAGAARVFGIEAGVLAAVTLLIILLQVYGGRWRVAQGPLRSSYRGPAP